MDVTHMGLVDSLLVSVLGLTIVFFVLIILIFFSLPKYFIAIYP